VVSIIMALTVTCFSLAKKTMKKKKKLFGPWLFALKSCLHHKVGEGGNIF
jgi:hypothetical protein